MRLLVTGGAGFIGSHLTDLLIDQNHDVLVLDDLSTGAEANLQQLANSPRLRLIQGSILDEDLVTKLMADVDGCFHLAAAVGVDLIVQRPLESLTTNIRGSEIVLQAALDNNVKTLVASSSEIYGKNKSALLSEEDDRILGSPLKARWTYSEAKAIEEAYAHILYREMRLPTFIARFFNVVGPRQTGDYGMVLPRFCAAAVANQPLRVFGDGEQSRVFCHVKDVVTALYSLFTSTSGYGEAFNIGGDEEISMSALAHRVIEVIGSQSTVTFEPYDVAYEPGFEDMPRRVPDISKIFKHTGWKPAIGLDEIITDVVRYQSETGRK